MTIENWLHIGLFILTCVSAFTAWQFKLIFDLKDAATRADEKSINYRAEMERRIESRRVEIDRRFEERHDDRQHEQTLFDFQMKALNDKHETQNIFLKAELVKIETSMVALHRRLDDFLNLKAQKEA